MIVTISGQAGSGKSTVARLLATALDFTHYSIGDMRRRMAEQRGLSLAQLNELGEAEEFTDRDVDEFQRRLGVEEDDFVVDGRTSWYFIPRSKKIYLDATLAERARRVFRDERAAESFASVADTERALEAREASDRCRYRKYYGIDVHDRNHYDLVIDTTETSPREIVARIVRYLRTPARGGTRPVR